MSYKIKDLVKDKIVNFQYYREGELWYKVQGTGFLFPVPTDSNEFGHATFKAEDKAMLFMRYIRKHLVYLEKGKEEQKEIDNQVKIEDGKYYCFYDDDKPDDHCIIEGAGCDSTECVHSNDHDIHKAEDCEFWKKVNVVTT